MSGRSARRAGPVVTDGAAEVAALLAEPTRMAMCTALLDGRAWTAGELGTVAGVAASTASEHLSGLVRAGLLTEERQGRHRYLRLAGPHVAQLLEDLAIVAGVRIEEPRSLRTARSAHGLTWARTCYDHLAGRVGVGLMEALVSLGMVDVTAGPALTAAGRQWVTGFAPAADLSGRRRAVLRPCLDWTERRHHLGGAVAAGICAELMDRDWIRQRPGERLVRVTDDGVAGLQSELGMDVDALRPG